jgi:hypothetical protein
MPSQDQPQNLGRVVLAAKEFRNMKSSTPIAGRHGGAAHRDRLAR